MMQCLLLILILSMPVVKTNVWKQRATDASCDYVLPVILDGWNWLHTGHQISPLPNRWWSFILGQWQLSLFDSICSTTSNWICSTTFRGCTGDLDCFSVAKRTILLVGKHWPFRSGNAQFERCGEPCIGSLSGLARLCGRRVPGRGSPRKGLQRVPCHLLTARLMKCSVPESSKRNVWKRCTVKKLLPLLSKAFYLGTPTTAALVLWFCSSLGKFVYGTILCVILWLRVGLLAFVCIEFILVESKTENRANSSVCPYQKATESN